MDPQEAKVIADFLLSTLEQELTMTTGVLSAVPADKLGYKPDSKSKSALGLLRHLTLEDEWILNSVAEGKFGPMPDDSDACGIMTTNDAVACYHQRIPPRSRAFAHYPERPWCGPLVSLGIWCLL